MITGYKLRSKITKNLKSRSTALSNAINEYNDCANKRDPPAPTLTFKSVIDYRFLSDFQLLRGSRRAQDLTTEPWTKPHVRDAVNMWMKVLRAKEEIERLHVEMVRLDAYIVDSEKKVDAVVADLQKTNPTLSKCVSDHFAWRRSANIRLRIDLKSTTQLHGYDGPKLQSLSSVAEDDTEHHDPAFPVEEELTEAQVEEIQRTEAVLSVFT